MAMTGRVARLRQFSLDAKPAISTQRAELMTEFYQQQNGLVSTSVFRARAFQYLLEHEEIYIGEGELIVGEKGPSPEAAPTFPELCCHSLADLDILNSRALSLDLDETLIALAISATTNPAAQAAMEKLPELAGCEMHMTHIPTPGDDAGLRRLGVNLTSDPNVSSKCLFVS